MYDSFEGCAHALVAILADLADDFLPVVGVCPRLQFLLVETVDDHAGETVDLDFLETLLKGGVLEVDFEGVFEMNYGILNGIAELFVVLSFDFEDLENGDQQQ